MSDALCFSSLLIILLLNFISNLYQHYDKKETFLIFSFSIVYYYLFMYILLYISITIYSPYIFT